MDFVNSINDIIISLNNIVWATPMIILIVGLAVYFTLRLRFVQVRRLKHQLSLLTKPLKQKSESGISPFEAFCTIIAYRVGTGNVAGIALAVWSGGPGAVFWMMFTSIFDAAVSYAECALGQVYKIRQDGEYRGGGYYYIQKGLGWKPVAWLYAVLTLICVPILTVGPHANSISTSLNNSFGISRVVVGIVLALLLFVVISGGIKRIAQTATVLVPVMTILYLIVTVIAIVVNIGAVPDTLALIVKSAFGADAMFGGLLGSAVMWGVKRSVNSSGAGMGEAVPAAAAAEASHPGEVGLINSFSVFIDLSVCICTGLLILLTDCFNVMGTGSTPLHIGSGAGIMAEQAANGEAGIVWAQAAAGAIMPEAIGKTLIALCLFFFAFTTVLNYYYQGETAIAYLLREKTAKLRKGVIWGLRIIMPFIFLFFAASPSSGSFAAGELGTGVLVWFNLIVILIMSNTVVKVHDDYMKQLDEGKDPVFDPEKLGIKNADLWMELKKERQE